MLVVDGLGEVEVSVGLIRWYVPSVRMATAYSLSLRIRTGGEISARFQAPATTPDEVQALAILTPEVRL